MSYLLSGEDLGEEDHGEHLGGLGEGDDGGDVFHAEVPQVAGGEAHSSFQSGVGELHAVVGFVGGAQALENGEAISFRGLRQIDLLEASGQRMVLLKDSAVFVVGGRADAFELAVR